jgi:hypothetical protein
MFSFFHGSLILFFFLFGEDLPICFFLSFQGTF